MCLKRMSTARMLAVNKPKKSDIDLRFLCGDSITYGDLCHISKALEEALGTEVDILTCKPEKLRPSFYDSIKDDEVLLYAAN